MANEKELVAAGPRVIHFRLWRVNGSRALKATAGQCTRSWAARHSSMLRIKSDGLAIGRYFRYGKSYAILIPSGFRDRLGLVPNDTVLMAYEYGILWITKPDKSLVMSREKVSKILDALFPDKEEKSVRT